MKISIITVCYNSADTLLTSLRSVAEQTHDDIDHVVIDGGSTDGTQALVQAHGARVTQFVSERDKGIYDAMNKGLRLAQGEVIAFLNADDRYAHPQVLAQVAKTMAEQGLDALLADVAFFRPEQPDVMVRRYRSDRFTPARIGWGWMPAHPALFVRKKVFDRTGPFRTDYRIAGDYEWVARAFKPGQARSDQLRFGHLPQVVVHMQMGGVSTRGWRSTLLLNQEVMRACRENGIATNWFKILSKYPLKMLEFVRS